MGKNCDIGFFAEEYPEKLRFNGQEVAIPEIFFRYAAANAAFHPKAIETYNIMLKNFNDQIGSLNSFVNNGFNWVRYGLSPLLSFTMEQLALNGCYSMGEDEFYQKYVLPKLTEIPVIYDQMNAALNEINTQQQARNERRVEERHFKAAINEGDEIGQMMLNGLKRLGDGAINMGKAALIYNDDVKKKIKDEFYYICKTMVDSFTEALYDTEQIDLRDPVSLEDFRRVNAVLKNLTEGKIPESKVDSVALEIFEKYPYNADLIEWALDRYGDENGDLQIIAKYFHIDLDDKKYRRIQGAFVSIDFSTEESTLTGLEKYLAREKFLGWKDDNNRIKIEQKLKEFDQIARTVDGVEYPTRDIAQNAIALNQFFASLDFSTEEKMFQSQKMFLEKEKELDLTNKKLEQKIEDMLKAADQNCRTCNGVEYSSREEAENAKKQNMKLKELVETCDFNSSENIQKVIDEIKGSEFTVPIAGKIVEKLQIRLEFLKFIPVDRIELLRLLLTIKVKIVLAVILLFGMTYFGDRLPLLAIICFVLIVAVFMATRKQMIKFSEIFTKQNKFKYAAFCSELAEQSKDEFMNISYGE